MMTKWLSESNNINIKLQRNRAIVTVYSLSVFFVPYSATFHYIGDSEAI